MRSIAQFAVLMFAMAASSAVRVENWNSSIRLDKDEVKFISESMAKDITNKYDLERNCKGRLARLFLNTKLLKQSDLEQKFLVGFRVNYENDKCLSKMPVSCHYTLEWKPDSVILSKVICGSLGSFLE